MNSAPAPSKMAPIDWNAYRIFLAVVEQGGLAAGAGYLGLTEQTCRGHLRRLEEVCGFPLFAHGVRGLGATPAGLRLVRHAVAMRAAANQIGADVETAPARRGTVTVIATELLGYALLTPAFQQLSRDRPDIAVDLRIRTELFLPHAAEADIAVLVTPPPGAGDRAELIGGLEIGLYARRDYLEAHGAPERSLDLKRLTLIGAESPATTQTILAAMSLDLSHDDFGYRTDSMIGGASAIRAGVGVGVGHVALLGQDLALERVLPQVGGHLPVWLVADVSSPATSAAHAVGQAIRSRLAAIVQSIPA